MSKIVGLISSYHEGSLLVGAADSLVGACDEIGVFEGPVGDNPMVALPADVGAALEMMPGLHVARARRYREPADKRNTALAWAKSVQAAWVVWLDADELLLWGPYLRDMIRRAEQQQEALQTAVGGFPIRVVELDGSVALSHNRVISTVLLRQYLHDAYQAELANGMVVALPNEKVCGAGGVPHGAFPHEVLPDGTVAPVQDYEDGRVQAFLGRHRPPVAGEPHVLHRAVLRDPSRQVQRLSKKEAEWFPPTP